MLWSGPWGTAGGGVPGEWSWRRESYKQAFVFSMVPTAGLPSVRQNLRATLMCLLLMAEHTEHLLSMSRHLDSFEKLPIILFAH